MRLNPPVLKHLLGRRVTLDVGRLLLVALVAALVGVGCMWGCADGYWSKYWQEESRVQIAEAAKATDGQAMAALANVNRVEIARALVERGGMTQAQRDENSRQEKAYQTAWEKDRPTRMQRGRKWVSGEKPAP